MLNRGSLSSPLLLPVPELEVGLEECEAVSADVAVAAMVNDPGRLRSYPTSSGLRLESWPSWAVHQGQFSRMKAAGSVQEYLWPCNWRPSLLQKIKFSNDIT